MKIKTIPSPMELCDYLINQGLTEKQAIRLSQIYYHEIIQPLEAVVNARLEASS